MAGRGHVVMCGGGRWDLFGLLEIAVDISVPPLSWRLLVYILSVMLGSIGVIIISSTNKQNRFEEGV